MCKKYGHNTRTCTARMRHDERQERRRNFYRKHAADLDCNLDRLDGSSSAPSVAQSTASMPSAPSSATSSAPCVGNPTHPTGSRGQKRRREDGSSSASGQGQGRGASSASTQSRGQRSTRGRGASSEREGQGQGEGIATAQGRGQNTTRGRGESSTTTAQGRGQRSTRGRGASSQGEGIATAQGRGQKSNLGLATRTRISGRLRTSVLQTGMHKSKGKLLVDLTGNPAGPPKVPGGGPACSWGPPRSATGITFRVAPPDFDMHNLVAASTVIPQPEVQGVAKKNDKGKKKMWRV
ncbi:uncharacterized protein LOC133869950 isoform X1 [Alnus glutinosa]|uniref:uncharacterized protein LOC133869950 isoform X1 n=1 Tax=Alnus glutinosa TaxID=3517 RepID=UPI002D7891E7|nr:uncharacterized protein LOC133869950 isoform X1 [Alnus glutinosa]